MAKYAGLIGYAIQTEDAPGVWTGHIVEHKMRGDMLRVYNAFESGDQVNDDVRLNNRISVVGDPYAFANFSSIRYAEYLGQNWKVVNVEVIKPRLILTIGGLWNGN